MAEFNQKRQDILNSAMELFKEKGFHNTRMEEIALKAGVGKGTLYEYFTSKQEIFDETCIEKVTGIKDKIEEISLRDITFREKLTEMISMKQGSEKCHEPTIEGIMSNKNIISEKVVYAMMNHVSDMNKIIIRMVEQGKKEGFVNKNIPSDLVVTMIVGTVSEFIRNKCTNNFAGISGEEIIINLLFNGFGVK
ncbi:TetR/AcrR family transcriptional regulator [Sedimentibacter sp. B4]|uniref:TetR/AcrR family transcriptional regulator n=1 Tax=Sedimentibacter sp. B4 TaxID=304766 RepID=UPI0002E6D57A|nr:TetR/AcrR family transcriptional regulator [Sedimentibacter sp. B4]